MNNDEEKAMDIHGITCKSKDASHYKAFRFDRLADMVRYAEFDAGRAGPGCGNT